MIVDKEFSLFRRLYDETCLCGCPGAYHAPNRKHGGLGACILTDLSQGLEDCECKRFRYAPDQDTGRRKVL